MISAATSRMTVRLPASSRPAPRPLRSEQTTTADRRLVGLVWGLFARATPFPRLALGAHVQFVANGMLFIVLGAVLLALPHTVGRGSIAVMRLAAWLTWAMALSEVANAWWGTRQLVPRHSQLPQRRLELALPRGRPAGMPIPDP